jgi:hypothetical protein
VNGMLGYGRGRVTQHLRMYFVLKKLMDEKREGQVEQWLVDPRELQKRLADLLIRSPRAPPPESLIG